ncbi:alpha/beta hydrolase-fold protein [Ferruginibacter sp. HRS2-29]|uniref:alpha/beta hydrolase-fold protein n=1 Tax=Ferruginibacter sp. HRS2-29 TaxID=2487334 RepID=UPI0020CDCEA7|nr:alpha/beta hydrolase-fold protein [Ferruginibacter sp. HRS2-29]MCP9750963.1 hypothetical protein [Ferruginibacter sp. HRS2-29]
MKKIILLLAFIAFSIAYCEAQDLRIFESLSMYSKILKQEVKYSVVLPEGYQKSNKRYPVVYLLHGLGDNESSWLEYGEISQVAGKAVKDKEIVPMIYVMPQGYRSYYVNDYAGTFLYQDMFVKELIPFIDSVYKTIADKKSRATVGYSMGGFGALVLPLKHPELFSACVPMSISIRTDDQYMEEDSNGWDDQWGRLFGAPGAKGKDRITTYYQQNSPLPMVELQDKQPWKDLAIYIDNGDDEETLAYSNEVLHQLLTQKNIPHEYRVRNGGHEFSYWRQSLTNGLRFISDKFQQKPYRGDVKPKAATTALLTNELLKKVTIGTREYDIYFPPEYSAGNRRYPVMYVLGDIPGTRRKEMATLAHAQMAGNQLAPFLMVFLPPNQDSLQEKIVKEMEEKYRARPGFRFRSLLLYGNGGQALPYALKTEQFTSCATIDASFDMGIFQKQASDITRKSLERTWYFFSTTDKSANSHVNGDLHMLFKRKEIYHEYRVGETPGTTADMTPLLTEIFQFTVKKIHR